MAPPLPTSDSDLVELARGGRDDAFAALYERYFPPVFDFLTRLLHDRQEAADVAQDTFIRAMERLGGLEKPESFKSWLFTIAHRTGLNRLERSRRSIAVAAVAGDEERGLNPLLTIVDQDRYGDPESVAEAQAVATYVWEAAVGLDPRTYAVLDLHVRQGLGSAEIADVLGVTKGNAYTMVNRMKKSVAESLGTYLLARKGSRDCADLAAILAGTALPPMTPEIRRAVDKHVKECEVCEENRRALLVPLRIFAGLALVPPLPGVKEAIWAAVSAAGAAGAGEGKGAGPAAAAAAAGAAVVAAGPGGGAAGAYGSGAGAGGGGAAAGGAGSSGAGAGSAGAAEAGASAGAAGAGVLGAAGAGVSAGGGAAGGGAGGGGAGGGGAGGGGAAGSGGGAGAAGGASTAAGAVAATVPWWQTTAARVAAAVVLAIGTIGGISYALFGGGDDAPVQVLSSGVTQPDAGGTGGDTTPGGGGSAAGTTTTTTGVTTTPSPTSSTTTTTVPPTTTTTSTTAPSSGGGGATPPAAADDTASVDEDGTVTIAVLANDVAVDATTVSVLSPPLGSTTLVDPTTGAIQFTPPRNASGTFTFRYRVRGTASGQVEAGVTVTVAPVNDAPVARNDSAVGPEDSIIEIAVLANDTDVDDPVTDLTVEVVGTPQHGTAVVTGSVVRYVPAPNYFGTDSLAYRACDPAGACAVGTVAITITPVNDSPFVPGPGTLTLDEEGSVEFDPLAGAADVEGQTLFLQSFDTTSAQGGTIRLGSLIYTPKPDYFGPDSFSYVVSDGEASTTVVVNVIVVNVNDAPRGAAPPLTTPEDTAASFDPLAGFTDPDGDPLSAVVPALPFTTPMGGTIDSGSDGSLVYTPKADYSGDDSFSFSVTDGSLATAATKSFTVTPVNDAPKVTVDLKAELEETLRIGTEVGAITATDVEGDPLTFSFGGDLAGVLAADDAGRITLVGALDFETSPVLVGSVEVSDGTDTTTVPLVVKLIDVDEPPAVPEGLVIEVPGNVEPKTVVGSVGAFDPEGGDVVYSNVRLEPAADKDAFALGEGGSVVATPAEGGFRFAEYRLRMDVSDLEGNTTQATITLVLVDGFTVRWPEPLFEAACPSEDTMVAFDAWLTRKGWSDETVVEVPWTVSHDGAVVAAGTVKLEPAEASPAAPGRSHLGWVEFPDGTLPAAATGTVDVRFVITDGDVVAETDSIFLELTSCREPPEQQNDGIDAPPLDEVPALEP